MRPPVRAAGKELEDRRINTGSTDDDVRDTMSGIHCRVLRARCGEPAGSEIRVRVELGDYDAVGHEGRRRQVDRRARSARRAAY